ncbi:hypothetical protein HRbin06_00043 [archaeon HR06]|nr:hypothetical protein HRbin06_00043 [archaeon HR06]
MDILKEDEELFQIYKKLKAKRIRELKEAKENLEEIVKILRKEADDYFILYITLRRLILGDFKGYEERKKYLLKRLE